MTKTALITGASRGLGFALAQALAPKFHIIAVARTVGGLEDLDDAIQAKGGQATLAPMDITDAEAMAHLCRGIHDRWGGLSLWAHTAVHAPPQSPAPHGDAKDFAKSFATNVAPLAHLVPFIAPLLGTDGQAMFFDDPKAGQKFFGAYGASKAAQRAFVESWAAESAKSGPRVHILTPPAMPTATRARFFPGESRDKLVAPADAARTLLEAIDDGSKADR